MLSQRSGSIVLLAIKGRHVRGNLHVYDVCRAIYEFCLNPRCGEVYNLGGGCENSISVLGAIDRSEHVLSKKLYCSYVDDNHISHISAIFRLKKG